ncbi:MAG: LytTR family DNA-binding domain-containing protein [Saprospiraceae bacterium]
MKQIWSWLNQAYPLELSLPRLMGSLIFGSFFVTFFLYTFRPFGMDGLSSGAAFSIAAGYGLITATVTLVWFGIMRFAQRWIDEESWSAGKEIVSDLLFVSLVGVGNMLYGAILFSEEITWGLFLGWQKLTFLVGLFPVVIGVLVKQIRLMRQFTLEASEINASLPGRPAHPVQKVLLRGDNQNEEVTLSADQILYLAAADNYVQVYYQTSEGVQSTMLRSTLKKMEDALSGISEMFRCHRTYLVNLDQVVEVSGNAQGFKLHLQGVDQTIPVSRTLNDSIHLKLAQIK